MPLKTKAPDRDRDRHFRQWKEVEEGPAVPPLLLPSYKQWQNTFSCSTRRRMEECICNSWASEKSRLELWCNPPTSHMCGGRQWRLPQTQSQASNRRRFTNMLAYL